MFYREQLVPFNGTESFNLYQDFSVATAILDQSKIGYIVELWESTSETVPNPWKVIVVENVISLFFAKNNKLFKIVVWDNYKGSLPNGISTGMDIATAQAIDSSLVYNDWNEDYESDNGYWIEDDVETKKIMSISIYIREVLDEDDFDYCRW